MLYFENQMSWDSTRISDRKPRTRKHLQPRTILSSQGRTNRPGTPFDTRVFRRNPTDRPLALAVLYRLA